MEGWKGGRLEGWKVGRGDGWKRGWVEEGMVGRLEGWRVIWMEERSTIKDECATVLLRLVQKLYTPRGLLKGCVKFLSLNLQNLHQ